MKSSRRNSKVWARRIVAGAVLTIIAGTVVLVWVSRHFSIPLNQLPSNLVRVAATPVLARLYARDQEVAEEIVAAYWHGAATVKSMHKSNPFVYEDPEVPYLKDFRDHFGLSDLVAGVPSEYEAILKLGGWVGSQFDHGTDPVVGGHSACSPVDLVEEGRAGSDYWCEIAARIMVHAAASLSLPARVVTASTDGYSWEHAVAEIWSNDYGKWFIVDTDFNYVYERHGIPLSAVELMQHGREWKASGELQIKTIAPSKPSIPRGDAIELYRYVHIDMRNDWCSRELRPGSPAGGDLATWWTASQDFGSLMVARRKVWDVSQMNWPVNTVYFAPARDAKSDKPHVLWAAYSPYYAFTERQAPDGTWYMQESDSIALEEGEKSIALRVVTRDGWRGPVATFEVPASMW